MTNIVNILDINVEKKNTKDNKISNLKNVKSRENNINFVISISFKNKMIKNKIAWNKIIKKIFSENQKNFHKINSYLFIGLESIKKIVFHSISLKSNWEPTNKTDINQNISIIANQKSVIIFLSSQSVSCPKEIEKIIKTKAKKIIKYKNLFLIISLKVFIVILNII